MGASWVPFGVPLGLLGCRSCSEVRSKTALAARFLTKREFQKKQGKTNGFSMFLLLEMAPKTSQDAPKTVSERYFFDVKNRDRFWCVLGSIWGTFGCHFRVIWGAKMGHFWDRILIDFLWGLQEAPKSGQEAPKRLPRGAKRLPRGAQEAPKRPQEAPKRCQEAPRGAQGAPKGRPRGTKRRQEAPRGTQELQKEHKRLQEDPRDFDVKNRDRCSFWARFWVPLGAILGSFGEAKWIIFGIIF